jgi:acyl dehydratase
MSADYINELMENELGRYWYQYARLSVAFLKPVLCGDTLTATGRLAESAEEGAVIRRLYEVWCENQRGELVTAGTATALVTPQK